MNPLSIISGFSLQTKALLITAVFIVGFISGYKVCGAFNEADEWQSINRQLKTAGSINKDTQKQVKQLQADEVKTKIIYRAIKEKIQNENDNRICFADSTALGLWNEAITGKDTDRPSVVTKTEPANSVVTTVEQVLTNAVENFQICNENSIKHNALIDHVESLNGKMCVCSE